MIVLTWQGFKITNTNFSSIVNNFFIFQLMIDTGKFLSYEELTYVIEVVNQLNKP